jgi:hypothetical protein
MGAWPPVSRDGGLIEPLESLAACTPHSAASGRPDSAAFVQQVRDAGTHAPRAVGPE